MKSKSKLKRKRAKARHQKSRYFVGGLKPFPAWGKLVAILGMTLASGLFLLVSVSAYFADYTGITLGFNIPTYYFTVDYNSKGGSEVASEDVKVGESITEPQPPTKTGYDFTSWHEDPNLLDTAWNFTINKMPRQNLTLYAKWTAQIYDITYELDGGANGANPLTYTYDVGVAKLEDAMRTGHTFVGWYDDATGGNPVTSISETAIGNKTLYARWTPDEYTITYNLNGGGTNHQDNPDNYTYGTGVASFEDATRLGYEFLGWFDSSSGGTKITAISNTALGNKTLYAQWKLVQYDIIYNLDGGINHASNPLKYTPGTGVSSFYGMSSKGTYYDFLGWYDAAVGGNEITSISADETGTKTLYAHWRAAYPVSNTATGTEFTFAGSEWRILDTDMNNDASDGLQALVIRVQPIGNSSILSTSPRNQNFFNTSTGSNAYEDSRNASVGGIGKTIDDWYLPNVGNTVLASVVQSVDLKNPDFNTFKSGITFSSGSTVTNWTWNTYYNDSRFPTTLDSAGTGKKQAFAISFGDIRVHMGISGSSSSRLSFPAPNNFWTRSPGYDTVGNGYIYNGGINSDQRITYGQTIRPALSIMIKKV